MSPSDSASKTRRIGSDNSSGVKRLRVVSLSSSCTPIRVFPRCSALRCHRALSRSELRGRDHSPSSGPRGATAPGSATGSPGHRPHSGSARARAPVAPQGRGGRQGKSDPSRGTGCDRCVDGLGDRDALPDCADGGPWRPAPSDGGPGDGSVPSSRRGRGRTPDRSRRDRGTSDRSSGGGAGPRCRSPQDDLRLDGEPKP